MALVRLLRANGGLYRPVGAGFLVLPQHILTCAHVVNDACGLSLQAADTPAAPVWLDMPLLPGAQVSSGRVIVWYPPLDSASHEPEDIAVLHLEPATVLPERARPAPITILQNDAFFDRNVRMCGFPAGLDYGEWVEGRCLGSTAHGWVQIKFAPGRQRTVAPGFSGTAVWDQRSQAVIGMIVSIDSRNSEISAFMIPSAILARAWSALQAQPMPSNPHAMQYSGATKLKFFRQLGDNWQDLATYFNIPSYDQARFEHGHEGRAVWTWLENRRRLGELPQALAGIGRADLAQLLTTGA
jgi:hypothetical protein